MFLERRRFIMEQGVGCIVADDFRKGNNFSMGNYCIIQEGCEVGDNVRLEHFVLLKKGTIIGDDTYVDSYVKSSGSNRIGSRVTLRFNATIARGVTIEDDVFISPNVMTIYTDYKGQAYPGTVIGKGSHIGTNAVIGQAVQIAPGTVVGALAFVNRDIKEPGVYAGIPAKKVRDL
jgi:UDP-2-acetamido-3-amino-2,3-dideoxy-glucuronate N-acetyltransferase